MGSGKWGGKVYEVFYFHIAKRLWRADIPAAVPVYTHFVHLIDLLLINLFWLSVFSLIFMTFFRQYLDFAFSSADGCGF